MYSTMEDQLSQTSDIAATSYYAIGATSAVSLHNLKVTVPKTKDLEIKFELNKRQIADLEEAFNLFDKDGVGKIDAEAAKIVLKTIGFDFSLPRLKMLIKDMTVDNTECLSFPEFLDLMTQKMTEVDLYEEILRSYHLIDCTSEGRITPSHLKRVVLKLEEDLSDEEIYEMIDALDTNEDGVLDWREFIKIMDRTKAELYV